MLTLGPGNEILKDGGPTGVFIMVGEPFVNVLVETMATLGSLTLQNWQQLKACYIRAQG
jgi:hypothetical protein